MLRPSLPQRLCVMLVAFMGIVNVRSALLVRNITRTAHGLRPLARQMHHLGGHHRLLGILVGVHLLEFWVLQTFQPWSLSMALQALGAQVL